MIILEVHETIQFSTSQEGKQFNSILSNIMYQNLMNWVKWK